MSKKRVEIFTDGACRGNPGPGGWGAILCYGSKEIQLQGAEALTTNNRMELQAAISALERLTRKCDVHVTTDSRYVMDGIQKWLANWKRNGWRTSSKKPLKNDDLWKKLDKLVEKHHVSWNWVKGHSGHQKNEQADQLANDAIDKILP